ncbi:MAG: hypothetical protein EOP78_01805 [Variovorax sp.]|nr:MAG: hypothetical protein EOP78_01805 [Variovorax sp.]
MRFQPRPLALCAVLFVGTTAFAQQPPPPGPAPAPQIAAEVAAPAITGRVQRWLTNPNGDVDGFLLADGTQVAFPPHLSAALLQSVKAGDTVQVAGFRAPNVPVLRATTVTAGGRTVADQPPTPCAEPPRPPGAASLSAMSASGRVARVLYTPRGDANGVLLDSGSIVRFPPHVGAALVPTLQPGSAVFAKGWGSRGAQGSAIEATAIGSSADTMRELFAGPGVEPPRPPGPRDPRGVPPAPAS